MERQSPHEIFREMPDHQACTLAWWDGERVHLDTVVNPACNEADLARLADWIKELAGRIEEFGLSRAVEIDGWQERSDGAYQLWARTVELEDFGL